MKKRNVTSYGRLLLSGAALAAVLSVGPSAFAAESKSTAALSGVERMVAIEEIRQLKYQWWSNIDNKKWNDALALFSSPDAKVEMIGLAKPDGSPITTAKEFIDFASGPYYSNGQRRAIHTGLNPIITFKSATEADGVWIFESVEFAVVDGKPGPADRHVWGQHFDRYVKTPGGWRIAFVRFGGGNLSTSTRFAPPPAAPKKQ